MDRYELSIPASFYPVIPAEYSIGVELDLQKSVMNFPYDFGHSVFANQHALQDTSNGNAFQMRLYPHLDTFLMLIIRKDGLGGGTIYGRCVVLSKDTEEYRQKLVLLKLTYG